MSESEFLGLLDRYRRNGVLVDTNLLLVYFVGSYDPTLIARFKRTQTFTSDDFRILAAILVRFPRVVTTPGILAEVNSLSNQLPEAVKLGYFGAFKGQLDILDERHLPSKQVAAHADFERCGLTDSAIMAVAGKKLLILTDDFRLSGYLQTKTRHRLHQLQSHSLLPALSSPRMNLA